MTPKRDHSVLIVEDERIVAKDLQQTLADMGYDAYAIASSAEEAIACASEKCPDVVLMDIRIKGQRDGIETAEILRFHFGVPIVYLTAHADDATIERAKKTEPYGYLMKPIKAGELRSAIEVCLYKHQMEKRLREREQLLTEQVNLQKQHELSDRLASLGTMGAGMAHEVNTPLAVVVANSQFVAEELAQLRAELNSVALSPEAERRLEDMSRALEDLVSGAVRIGRIISDFNAFSRPEPKNPGLVDVARCLGNAIRAKSRELHDRAHLVIQLGDVPAVSADEGRLTQVFVSLLDNAAQAILPGAAERNEVGITTRLDENRRVAIEISDTGSGIRRDILPRIFEPFFTTRGVGAGAGLGLSICHGIVTALGGELRVESELGKGARFVVLLPAAGEETGKPEAVTRGQSKLLRGRILVIDDEPMALRTLGRLLRDHDVVCVESAAEALALIEGGERFDVIFSELMMPEMSGKDFYEVLLGRDPVLAERVIFIGGAALTDEIDDFLLSVPNRQVGKPFDVASLLESIQQRLASQAEQRPRTTS